MPDDSIKHGEEVLRHLRKMVREMLARKAGGHLVEPTLRDIPLELTAPLRGGVESFSRSLAAEIDSYLDDAVQHAAAFRPGHAFCHRCGGPECPHSLPPSARHVFVGYLQTGMPRWEDFAQHCLDIGHEQVDRLYSDPPAFLTMVRDAGELHGNMLNAFEHPTYRLLGQMTAGYFRGRYFTS